MSNQEFYAALARSFLGGKSGLKPIVARASNTLGRKWRWLPPLVQRFMLAFPGDRRPSYKAVIAFLAADQGLREAMYRYAGRVKIRNWIHEPNIMRPVLAAREWPVVVLESVGELASWLGLSPDELDWYANLKHLPTAVALKDGCGALSHYTYKILSKPQGGIRLIEAPKRMLKSLQTRILRGILDEIPVHPSAHGFIRNHSIKTFASPHVGQKIVVRMDLCSFFPSLTFPRIRAVFRTAGYPEPVAELLGGLCTNAVPRNVFPTNRQFNHETTFEARQLYGRAHLPQGAPTSPTLSNLCAYRLDCRLAALALSAGATYTRYADDLAFSGGDSFAKCAERFATHVAVIVGEEGFSIQHRKTRIMRTGVRQHLAGMVVNRHLNVRRVDFDRLKAMLTNCVRYGPLSQNREAHPAFRAHLDGNVGFVEMVNPVRGARLRKIFEQILW